jgi:hypothetical protein
MRFYNKIALNPKNIFLIDGLGAFLSAISLFTILSCFNEYIRLPKATLSILSIIAILFCVYSLSCFFHVNKNWHLYLLAIIIANLFYSFLTLGLVIYNYSEMTILGVSYFLLEIIIIGGIVFFEINILSLIKLKSHPNFKI